MTPETRIVQLIDMMGVSDEAGFVVTTGWPPE
jgi:hypothetical protein